MFHKFTTTVLVLAIVFFGVVPTEKVSAQEPIVSGWSYTQIFDGIGVSGTATLPANWKVDKSTATPGTVGTWAAAVTATERVGGNNMSTTATNGIYNYGAGDAATATDRAIGWISSSSATKNGNLYLWLRNDSPNHDLGSLSISYDVEKYRNGSNTAGFAVQLYYSTDGNTWTSAGSNFRTSFPADADNSGFASAPGATQSISNQVLELPAAIPPAGSLYLAWNYAVASGTITSNAQGLGIDNVTLNSPKQPNAITLRTLTAGAPLTPLATALPALGLATLGGLALSRRRRA